MSLMMSIQKWLEQFSGIELTPVSTNIVSVEKGCALAPAGDDLTTTDILGNVTYTKNYAFLFREDAANEIDRQEYQSGLEEFQEWIETQNLLMKYPQLKNPFKVEQITVSNLMLFDLSESGIATYQMQIQVIILKEE